MAQYTAKDTAKYGTEAKTSAEWQKVFHDTMGIGYKPAATLWKQYIIEGTFIPAAGTKIPKTRTAKVSKKIEKVPETPKIEEKPVIKPPKQPEPGKEWRVVKDEIDGISFEAKAFEGTESEVKKFAASHSNDIICPPYLGTGCWRCTYWEKNRK